MKRVKALPLSWANAPPNGFLNKYLAMSTHNLNRAPVLVVGAGIMGMGIAQVAAQAGHAVLVYDTRADAVPQAKQKLADSLAALVAKGKMTAEAVQALLARITPVAQLRDAPHVSLVVEAIVENLAVKCSLFQELEGLVSEQCVLATNTSSISVTAIANGLKHPQRLVGMHFFNPVPLMKLVEVVSGLQTDANVAQAISDLAGSWGKTAVHARSTPGFIVNRIARPFYAESLGLLQEQAARPEQLDALLRGVGFRMGPCELMDLIGHDTNFSVTQSVFEANFFDRRFTPSLVQRELVDGGLLGRKTGRGFYSYPEGAPALPATHVAALPANTQWVVHGSGAVADALASAVTQYAQGKAASRATSSAWVGIEVSGLQLHQTDGRPAWQVAQALDLKNMAVFDELPTVAGGALAFATVGADDVAHTAAAVLQALGFAPIQMADAPGLVVARTLAMLVNEAADAVLQGVCTTGGANAAMKLGVNYPAGPFDWLARMGRTRVVSVLHALDACYRGERYRVSPWLQRETV
jgi:3-hydroxybutyryl-CoA dehydrogenase